MKLPHKDDQTWPSCVDEEKKDNPFLTLTAKGRERIEVPAGEFETIRVDYREERSKDPSQTRWYAPDIGLVKVKANDVLIVLKSFSANKE